MRKLIKFILGLILAVLAAVLIYFLGILLINIVYDYRPQGGNYELAAFHKYPRMEVGRQYSVISWNIGYGGLGREADFFYDGGSMSRPDKDLFDKYSRGIRDRLRSLDTVDIFLIQEVDLSSDRSYNSDQREIIQTILQSHESLFATNYNVKFVPLPLSDPMGAVVSGLQLIAKHRIQGAYWHPFRRDRSWPLGLFKPDRCFQVAEFEVSSSQHLYVFHTHNSAFDDGSQREEQIEMLFAEMRKAYKSGHYVIAGGDWNLNPSAWEKQGYKSGDLPFMLPQQALDLPGRDWKHVFDPQYPTNREVSAAYVPGQTPCTIIDFFICSPNIEIKRVKTLYDAFEFSDHQPVYLSFELMY